MEKRLIAALAVCLGGALLVIAFLIGRMTGASGTHSPSSAPSVSAVQVPAPPIAGNETRSDPPPLLAAPAARNEELPGVTAPETPPLSQPLNRAEGLPTPHAPVETSEIASYFAKVDAIRVTGSGDPTIFAQGILSGLEHGDTAGLDQLVDGAKLALTQAEALQPPPSCADYHRHLLDALSDAVAGMVKMRDAIAKNDADGAAAVVSQVQATQQKIEDLDRMKKQLLGP